MKNKAHALEEHWGAYFIWKRLGIRQAWCWHVDAHLDIGRDGLHSANLDRLAKCETPEQAVELMGNSYLPWGGLHCGNYLYPAIKEGLVGRLTWVIPPNLPERELLTWSREHLNSWFEITLAEYQSLRLDGGRVVGTLLGIPFEMGPLEVLTLPAQPVLLDIDIDYFLEEDGTPWTEPAPLQEAVGQFPSLCTTVAYSVKGGFTPDRCRSFADPFLENPPDTPYKAGPLDDLAALVRSHHYQQALPLCQDLLDQHPVEASYYLGSCHHHLKDYQKALDCWADLLEHPTLPDDGRAYLEGLCSELALQLQQSTKALEYARQAARKQPWDYRHLSLEAAACEALGDLRRATQLLRRALKLAEGSLFSLKLHLALAKLYRRQGKSGLVKIELDRLAALDVTGQFRHQTLLG